MKTQDRSHNDMFHPEPDRCDQCGVGLFDNRKAVWTPEMRVHLCKKCHAQYENIRRIQGKRGAG